MHAAGNRSESDRCQVEPAGIPSRPRRANPVAPVVALIGGIGSGKSTVATEFGRRGAVVISGDAAGHEALRQPEVRDAVVRRWGERVLSGGEVDRKKLAAIVFADPAELAALEAVVHPWIGRRLQEQINQARTRPDVPLIVLDAAVLLEAGWNGVCDYIVFVHADDAVRRQRVLQRGWKPDELARREAMQLPLTQKRGRADHVLDNSSSLDHLARQVDDLMQRWLSPELVRVASPARREEVAGPPPPLGVVKSHNPLE